MRTRLATGVAALAAAGLVTSCAGSVEGRAGPAPQATPTPPSATPTGPPRAGADVRTTSPPPPTSPAKKTTSVITTTPASTTDRPVPPSSTPRTPSPLDEDEPTDEQGFVNDRGARCNADDPSVATVLTSGSRIAVCRTGAGRYYWRGSRIRDGASIELDDPTVEGDAIVARNGSVSYVLTPEELLITSADGTVVQQPVIRYQ